MALVLSTALVIGMCGCGAIFTRKSIATGTKQGNMSMETEITEESSLQTARETSPIEVSSVEEFLAAIDSNVTIYLKEGTYNLSEAADYGMETTGSYYWEEVHDGYEFTIQNVNNLHIVGAGKGKTVLTSDPRYAHVVVFDSCDQVEVSDLTAGHTERPGECAGGVLRFMGSTNSVVRQCGLFGCGTFGVTTEGASNLNILDSEIYDCTIGALSLSNSQMIAIDGCNIHDCPMPLLEVYGCTDIIMDGEIVDSIDF